MSETGAGATMVDRLLAEMQDTQQVVSIYLVNGFQMKGMVTGFDRDTILFKIKDAHQLVMRAAMATIYPLPVSKGNGQPWWEEYQVAPPE